MIHRRKTPLAAKILLAWWIIVLVFGFFGNFWMVSKAIEAGGIAPALVFSALGIGCAVMLCG